MKKEIKGCGEILENTNGMLRCSKGQLCPKCKEKEIKDYMKKYRKENNEKLKNQKRIWNEKNKDKISKQKKEWSRRNPDKIKKAREKEKIKRKKTNYNQKPQVKKSKLEWRKKNRGYNKKYYEENKKDLLKKNYAYIENKTKTDKEFDIKRRLRHSLRTALKVYAHQNKIYSSKQYGISYKAIIEHLKPLPKNIKKYHIDHIRPLCSFKFTNNDDTQNVEAIKEAFKPENHRLILIKANLKKSSKDKKKSIYNVKNRIERREK